MNYIPKTRTSFSLDIGLEIVHSLRLLSCSTFFFFGKGFGVKRVAKARLRLLKQRVMIVTEEEK
jgi:hypothetical protein